MIGEYWHIDFTIIASGSYRVRADSEDEAKQAFIKEHLRPVDAIAHTKAKTAVYNLVNVYPE